MLKKQSLLVRKLMIVYCNICNHFQDLLKLLSRATLQMEVNTWIQQLVDFQVPGLENSQLEYIRNSVDISKFMTDMNSTTLFICFDKKVSTR